MNSLISPDNHWLIWTSLIAMSTLSIFLEEKFTLFKKLTGALVAMILGMILSNVGVLPTEAPAYDTVWEYIVPLVIPLLLMKIDIMKIIRETGALFWTFHLSALGTIIGSIVAIVLLHSAVENIELIVPAMTGSYIGGAINFVALISAFEPPKDLVNATIVADNGVMALYFIFLITIPSFAISKKWFPRIDKSKDLTIKKAAAGEDHTASKQITLLNIGSALTVAFIITSVSVLISEHFSDEKYSNFIHILLGQKYILLTTLSILFPIAFPKIAKRINGNNEIGIFFIFLFFVLIGIPASIQTVITEAPVMLLFCAIILTFNFLVTFTLGRLFKFELEELVLAAIVSSGGPMNGIAIAKAKGWNSYILPSLLIGIWGYIIGNYTGFLTGIILKTL
ncbi:MAG: DUF819 family protein [Bacteroidota bacterium]